MVSQYSYILKEIQNRIQDREKSLSPFASVARLSKGRIKIEPPSPTRGEFQRDRDRIIHTNSFRRMKHKSQVLIAPQGDHFTTRLTHVMEVAQIARTIARALNLNEDLTEAAALGHDLGHTPFGHIGEEVFDSILPDGFHHSRQSIRIVTVIEKQGQGLNLMDETLQAIRRHSKPQGEFINKDAVKDMTLEAQIVRLSDALAYLTHDMNDAIRAGVLSIEDFPKHIIYSLGKTHAQRVNTLVTDVILNSWECTESSADNSQYLPWIQTSRAVIQQVTELRNFMFERFYYPTSNSPAGQKAKYIIRMLFEHYMANVHLIPESVHTIAKNNDLQAIADYICGMTDNFVLTIAERLQPGISEGVFQGRI